MSLSRCRNGHLFDAVKNHACPYCGIFDPELNKAGGFGEGQQQKEAAAPEPISDATRGVFQVSLGFDPPVGWLVCVDGPPRGTDYRIRSENNSIGRSDSMRICILGDDSIARDEHAFLTYDPASNSYYIRPGSATGMVYHNRTPVFSPQELKPFDEIKLGKSTFLFVPLCGEFGAKGFRWA